MKEAAIRRLDFSEEIVHIVESIKVCNSKFV